MNRNLFISLLYIAAMLSCLLFLTSCSSSDKKNSDSSVSKDSIYLLDSKETMITVDKCIIKGRTVKEKVEFLLNKMKAKPGNINLKQVIPDNVEVQDIIIDDNENITLYFNSAYYDLTGPAEVLRRAAIVKNLCQKGGVRGVQIYAAGQPLTDASGNPIGIMRADDFIDNTSGETRYMQEASLNIYLAEADSDKLVKIPVKIHYDSKYPIEQMIMDQLIKGPAGIKGIDQDQYLSTIPKGTIVNNITIRNTTCYVDFSDDFLNTPEGVTPEASIYSVVNTLTELPGVNRVQFSIDGKQQLKYNNNINFGKIFQRNLDIVDQD
jgi:germination protein M